MADTTNQERRDQRSESHKQQTMAAFSKDLASRAAIGELEAGKVAASVLCALEQRIFGNEVEDLEAQLPRKLQELLSRCPRHQGKAPEKFGRDEFIDMIASDLDCAKEEAERLARAVFATVRDHISEGEVDDVAGQLPEDLRALWARDI